MSGAWIDVVGIGEDGLDGVSPAARALIDGAEVLVGGARHHGMVAKSAAERLAWDDGLDAAFDAIEARRGRRIVVLGSGDPMFFGIGSTLMRRFGADALRVLPQPSSFSLACARLGWSLPDTRTLTIHGRPVQQLHLHLYPGVRLMMLARDGGSAAEVAALLTARGFGPSRLIALEHMGGPAEGRVEGRAESWGGRRVADLNVLAVDCVAGPAARPLSPVAGLPDDAFEHDGQITKREVRAATIAALAPLPGQMLWDVGAGSGAVAIEWLRAVPTTRALAIERNPDRQAMIARNAAALGVPHLEIRRGAAPAALAVDDGAAPDAVFAGGSVSVPGLLGACWTALRPGGRLVANAVTVEAEARLAAFHKSHGGDLVRISVARHDAVGSLTTLRPLLAVTQLAVSKP